MSYKNYTNCAPSYSHLDLCAHIKAEVQNLEIALYKKNQCLESKHQENYVLIKTTRNLEQENFFNQVELDKLKKKFNDFSENKENYIIKYKKLLEQLSLMKNKMKAITKKITDVSNDVAEMERTTADKAEKKSS